ncbi:MAG: ABC transporter permease [Candidatus Azobacteroides sp.]|nr:ABC transporter permease [Candidatus Azobacteroides sp.]
MDNWAEIFSSIQRNRLRMFLTGFSIAWGIFMFVILLSTVNGVRKGISIVFEKRASNAVQIQGRSTSLPYEGLPDNRKINLDQKDYELLSNRFSEKEYLSALIPAEVAMTYKNNNTSGICTGIYPEYSKIGGIKIVGNQGRLLGEMDMKEKRKVAIINQRLKDVLYKDEDPVGKELLVNKLKFTIVGVYTESAILDRERIYIPFTTAQTLFNGGWGFKSLAFTVKDLNTNKENDRFNNRLMDNLSEIHRFDPNDKIAINLSNQLKTYLQTVGILNAINICIWIVGGGTLFAGMVGVSNIMLIAVRERTKEFGIRKALGAPPSSIIQSIVLESVCVTTFFGYLGLFMGICVTGLFNVYLKNHPDASNFAVFKNPSVNIEVALGAMFVLVVVGVLAGYFPARQAVRITPVEAMRDK